MQIQQRVRSIVFLWQWILYIFRDKSYARKIHLISHDETEFVSIFSQK